MKYKANNEVALHVADPTEASRFYIDVLGCRMIDDNPECIALDNGALRLYLVRDPARLHDATILSFDVSDRNAALLDLQRRGCTLIPIGAHAPDGVYIRDPFGIVFDVVQR